MPRALPAAGVRTGHSKRIVASLLVVREQDVLAVEAMERELNNGGYSQFFVSSSNEVHWRIEDAFVAIECPKSVGITRDAIAALNVEGEPTASAAEAVVLAEDGAVLELWSLRRSILCQ